MPNPKPNPDPDHDPEPDLEHVPLDAVVEWFTSRVFEKDLGYYVAFAAKLLRGLGLGERRSGIRGGIEPEDIVDAAAEACMSGDRRCPAGLELGTFFCGVIRSTVSHEICAMKLRGAEGLEDVPEPAAPSSHRDDRIHDRRRLARIKRVLSHDPRTRAMFEAVEDGAETLAAIAEKCRWTPEEAKAVRVIANRRLTAAGLRKEDER